MRNTLREIISEALEIIETIPRKEWMYMWPGKIVLCGGQTYWIAHVEESITNNTLLDYYNMMLLHVLRANVTSLFYKDSEQGLKYLFATT